MSRCDYAGCVRTDTKPAARWVFCPPHMDDHNDLMAEEKAPPRRLPKKTGPTTRERVADLHALGMSDAEIAAALPCSRDTAESYRRGLRLPANRGSVVRQLKPCGTHAAFVRHKDRGEPIDAACEQAERDYQRAHKRKRRAS